MFPPPNYASILDNELNKFLEVHQRSLLPSKLSLFNSLRSFFKTHMFPVAETWVYNITNEAIQELTNPLSIEITPNSTLSENQKSQILNLIHLSMAINPEITLYKMKSLSSYFKEDASFKLRSLISQWWLGVREK